MNRVVGTARDLHLTPRRLAYELDFYAGRRTSGVSNFLASGYLSRDCAVEVVTQRDDSDY